MSDSDSFIREVTEEVRADRMYKLWRRYAPLVIGGIVAIVGAAAAWQWWQYAEAEAAKERGGAFLSAGEDVFARQAVVEQVDGPAEAVARLDLAAAQAAAGDTAAAIETYRSVATDARLKRAYTDLAALEAARLEAPGLPLEEAEGALAGLAGEGAPYRPLALELRAALRLNAGDREGAEADLEAILAEPGLTRGLAARARQMLAILAGPEAVEAAEARARSPQAAPGAEEPGDGG